MAPSALFVTTVPITLEAFLLPFADMLRDEGWKVDALSSGARGHKQIEGHFDRRFDVPWSRNPLSTKNLIGTSRRVREIVGRGAYDVVHVHTPIAAFVTRWALRKLPDMTRPTIVYTTHGFHFYAGQKRLPHMLYRTLERVAGRWTDILVTINEQDFSAAVDLGTILPGDVRYIPGVGVDTELFSPLVLTAVGRDDMRGDFAIDRDGVMITMIAELAPVKRHALALAALAQVDPIATLVLVGVGPLEEKIRREAYHLGIEHRVRFAGYRRDVELILCASDLAILTSEREGLPRSILEALACGTVAVGTDTRGITDAIGNPSLIAGHDDPAGLAAIINGLLADRPRLAALSKAARARAVEKFSLADIEDAYRTLYAEALARRDQRAQTGGDRS